MSEVNFFAGPDWLHYLDFDAKSWRFNRDILDSKPYKMVRGEKSTEIYLNCLGVDVNDISVKIEDEGRNSYLVVNGETKIDRLQTYNVNAKFVVYPDEIESVEYAAKNGLLIITVIFKTVEKAKIPINQKKIADAPKKVMLS